MNLQKIPGFETTAYAYQGGRIVWAGVDGATDHPRNALKPWEPGAQPLQVNITDLQAGAAICLALFGPAETHPLQARGLINWLLGQALDFPLNRAVGRFDAVRNGLNRHDLAAFTAASLKVLGLGHGLTPSGDDFVGGVMFTLHHLRASVSDLSWLDGLPPAARQLQQAAQTQTNVISAALLDDLMTGRSYRALHDLLAALNTRDAVTIETATARLLALGASSGADMLAGVLLAIGTLRSHH